jgi:hypothetical protein
LIRFEKNKVEFKMRYWIFVGLLGLVLTASCSSADSGRITQSRTPTHLPIASAQPTADHGISTDNANILDVKVNGEPGDYSFSVTVSSPDEGCSQYADWWEVIDQEGELIYRRILLHSHVDEQPFTRSGGPVPIEADTVVLVRAHMQPSGYGSQAVKGSPRQGFKPIELSPEFAADLSEMPPLPGDCGF